MTMALFDLDNTLLGGDSDYLWGEFLVGVGAVDKQVHQRENARYLAQYQAGALDVHEFLSFQLEPLTDNPVDSLLATQPEFDGQHYTGKYLGEPCSGIGKVHWVREWAARTGMSLADSWFYSDSYQDLPLLSLVDHPVAVDPDDALREHARLQKWPILSLR